MKTPPEFERLRAHDDQAVGVATEMMAILAPLVPASDIYRQIQSNIRAAKDNDDPVGAAIGVMSLVGFWAAIESMERSIRESEGVA